MQIDSKAVFLIFLVVSLGVTILVLLEIQKDMADIQIAKTIAIYSIDRQTDIAQESRKNKTSGWETYRNNEYGFEVRYPKGWLAEESREVVVLRSTAFVEKKVKDCCPFAIQKPGDAEKIVKIYVGEVKISPKTVQVDQRCWESGPYKVEFFKTNSIEWTGCLLHFEGLSIPYFITAAKLPPLELSGGFDREKYLDVKNLNEYNFILEDIIKTFRFIK